MNKDTDLLVKKIIILIESLNETENPTVKFFYGVIEKIKNCGNEKELKSVLDDHLIHAGKIKDYGGFSLEQCSLFNDMWKVAKNIYEA